MALNSLERERIIQQLIKFRDEDHSPTQLVDVVYEALDGKLNIVELAVLVREVAAGNQAFLLLAEALTKVHQAASQRKTLHVPFLHVPLRSRYRSGIDKRFIGHAYRTPE